MKRYAIPFLVLPAVLIIFACSQVSSKPKQSVKPKPVQQKVNPKPVKPNKVTWLCRASQNGNLQVVRDILKKQAHLNYKCGESHSSAIFLAARQGHLEIVRGLVKAGANPNVPNRYKKTALDIAIERSKDPTKKKASHQKVIKTLRQAGGKRFVEMQKKKAR